VLLVALAFGLIGMHNLVAFDAGHPELSPGAAVVLTDMTGCCQDHDMSVGSTGHSSGHDHDFLHLCLAVLSQLAALVAMLALFVGLAGWVGRLRLPVPRAVARAPDRPGGNGRTILTSVCVLRL
jgi:hypothetical protein